MRTPRILVTDGWITDQNDSLTEVVISSSVKTLQSPKKVTFYGETLNYIPGATTALEELYCPNIISVSPQLCNGFSSLTSVNMPKVTTLTQNSSSSSNFGTFSGCTSLVSVYFPSVTSISRSSGAGYGSGVFSGCSSLQSASFPELLTMVSNIGGTGGYGGVFYNCTSLQNFYAPKLTTITQAGANSGAGCFSGCTSLIEVTLPSIKDIITDNNPNPGIFRACTGLQMVQLGSEGNPVASIGKGTFNGCTQSSLTITIYTTGGAALANSPWGATNATIVYEEA